MSVNLRDYVSEEAAKNIEHWLSEEKYAQYKPELEAMIQQEKWQDLEDAFFKVIEFGTAGRRGTTGIGSNRINRVTIGESAQALCEYAKTFDEKAPEKGIAIAYDTRLSSPELSKYAASVCAGNGFKTYIFEDFRATPELSFAVRELGCSAGIVISASHNQPADNGFKAYWSDGGQLVPPHDKGVLDAAAKITEIKTVNYEEAVKNGSIVVLDKELDEKYLAAVLAQSENKARDITIAYSPLHGAGQTNTLQVLQKAGFNVSVVVDQMVPDGNFPTIENGKPNPGERTANDRAVAQMLAEGADLAITNDPDADRIGVMVRQGDRAIYLNGNQSAVLAAEYTLRKKAENNELTPKHYVGKTIVTTDMIKAVADKYNVKTYGNMLIGFKYISELIHSKEGSDEVFVIGGEESYGLLIGDYTRDKDGAVGALSLAEYAAELKTEGKTLWDRLVELYRQYGLYIERLDTMVCPGAEGFKEMQMIMQSLRDEPPKQIDDHKVTAIYDYQTLTRTDTTTGATTPIDCIKGNVYVLEFGDARCRLTIRPSGTEPKLNFYNQWYEEPANPEEDLGTLMQEMENTSRELEGMLFERIGKTRS